MNPWTIELRRWQANAFDAYKQANKDNFLVAATPGAGKTLFTARVAHLLIEAGEIERLMIVCPTEHLKRQWANALHTVGIELQPDWGGFAVRAGMDGICLTYGMVHTQRDVLRALASRQSTMVVLDEVHHCGEYRSWGEAIGRAFEPAHKRLLLSGTPFRQRGEPIPFVEYEDKQDELGRHKAKADYTYSYGQALLDGICRPVYFPAYEVDANFLSNTGDVISARFADVLPENQISERMNTALDVTGEWLPRVLREADDKLRFLRREDTTAGGLVIAKDTMHADAIADLLARVTGERPMLAHSDVDDPKSVIGAFSEGRQPWLVAVRMVSEGVDIPRLRVGVYATNYVAPLFFIQAVGRFVRMPRNAQTEQSAYLFVPSDERLTSHIQDIRGDIAGYEQEMQERADRVLEVEEAREVQQSIFVPISATAELDNTYTHTGEEIPADLMRRATEIQRARNLVITTEVIASILMDAGVTVNTTVTVKPRNERPAYQQIDQLRQDCNALAKKLARMQAPEATNAEFGRVVARIQMMANTDLGYGAQNEMGVTDLEAKKTLLTQWIKTARAREGGNGTL
jgi:superfamily II DNA or RNA helicase